MEDNVIYWALNGFSWNETEKARIIRWRQLRAEERRHLATTEMFGLRKRPKVPLLGELLAESEKKGRTSASL